MLHSATHKTPIGELNIIVEEHVLLAAGFKSLENLVVRLSPEDADKEIKHMGKIPVISELISDYFDGNLNAFNPIKVRQPGAKFSQEVGRSCGKFQPEKRFHMPSWPSEQDLPMQLELLVRHVAII